MSLFVFISLTMPSERREYGLPHVYITEQELLEVREGYDISPRLQIFRDNPVGAKCRVRVTMWELSIINDNRRIFYRDPPIVLSDSVSLEQRWIASDWYEATLERQRAKWEEDHAAANGGN